MTRFWEYIKVREQEDKDEQSLVEISKSNDRQDLRQIMQRNIEKKQRQKGKKARYDSGNVLKKAKKSNSYVSNLVLFTAQVFMFILAYAYHSSAGFICVCWLVSSFLLSTNNTLFISVVFMVPVLSWEFIFIYFARVPLIKNTQFFADYGKYFRLTMWNPLFE